jgi:predicted nuclease of restriction endonuclease-like RecB superfamily
VGKGGEVNCGSRSAYAKSDIPSEKQTKAKVARGMAQVVEHLPNKCKALSSISLSSQKRRKLLFGLQPTFDNWRQAFVVACSPMTLY